MKRIHLHPLPLRIWHWANALMVIFLLITGIELRIPGVAALPANSPALLVHRYTGWSMMISCLFWFVYSLMSGNLSRHYVIRRGDLNGTFKQVKFYLFSIFRGEENPFRASHDERFNPLQRLAYGAMMWVFTPIIVVTGLFFSDILFFRKYLLLLNAMKVLDAIHVIIAYMFALYLIVHIYMATLGRKASSHIKAMIVGYEEEPDEPEMMVSYKEGPGEPDTTMPMISPETAATCQECHTEKEGTNADG
jgi:thiosulfate reductase cytochrome b subunit